MLVFETDPLSEDVAVVGPITVRLWIARSAPDTDFTAKLIDVHPPTATTPTGFALNLTDGILRCRYRELLGEAGARSWPGEVFAVTIEPFATANLFAKGPSHPAGHRLLQLPEFDVNPQSGEARGLGAAVAGWRRTRFSAMPRGRPVVCRSSAEKRWWR